MKTHELDVVCWVINIVMNTNIFTVKILMKYLFKKKSNK